MRQYGLRWGVVIALMLFVSSALQAQIYLSLTPADNSVHAGDRLQLTGRLVNNTADTYFLTGSSGNVGGGSTDLVWDDLDFFNAMPSSLSPGDFYENNLYLDVVPDAPENVLTATYTVTAEFGEPPTPINITSSVRVAVVPSPTSWAVMACGFAGLYGVRRKRKNV